ncbi:MAG: hypothetical protein JW945_05840 [Methanomicrobia archaeon]|nr:hypothetical protein [Methanomicrobia archaeon]
MRSLSIDPGMAVRRKLIWCFFWTNRKAIRSEGCAPFHINRIVSDEITFRPEHGDALTLTDELLHQVEGDLTARKRVAFTITLGAETFDLTFHNDLLSVAARRNSELEIEIVESLQDELMRGKPNFCASFIKRLGIDLHA